MSGPGPVSAHAQVTTIETAHPPDGSGMGLLRIRALPSTPWRFAQSQANRHQVRLPGGIKMNANQKERLAQAIIQLIETDPEVRAAVISCACCSPNIVKVI